MFCSTIFIITIDINIHSFDSSTTPFIDQSSDDNLILLY